MWEAYEKRRNFIQWATPAGPKTKAGAPWRIAVVRRDPFPGLDWVLYIGEGDKGHRQPGGGAFYDDSPTQPGGAVASAVRSARAYAARSLAYAGPVNVMATADAASV